MAIYNTIWARNLTAEALERGPLVASPVQRGCIYAALALFGAGDALAVTPAPESA